MTLLILFRVPHAAITHTPPPLPSLTIHADEAVPTEDGTPTAPILVGTAQANPWTEGAA